MGNCPDSECYVVSKNAGRYTVGSILSFYILMFYVNVMIPVYKCKYMNYIVLLQKKIIPGICGRRRCSGFCNRARSSG